MRATIRTAVLLCIPALSLARPTPTPAPAPAATPAPGHHDRKPDDPFRRQELSRGVYVLYGQGGNVGFLAGAGADAVVVVDSQFKGLAPGIVKQIQGVTAKPIKYLVNTHHHGDHTGGNEVFRPFAVILAHDNVRRRMLESPQSILKRYPAELEEARKKGDAELVAYLEDSIAWAKKVRVEEIAAPVVTYDSELRIHVGDETIDVWHTPPAHTDGDSIVYFRKAKVLHMGDNFFHRIIPFIDASSGGSARGYQAALDEVLARVPPDAKIIPGHGEVTDVAGLRAFRQYIADVLEAARAARARGQSKEEFLRTVRLPAYEGWDGYAERFPQNCEVAWNEVAAP